MPRKKTKTSIVRKRTARQKRAPGPVTSLPSRKIGSGIQIHLVAASAGRCEFRGCNKFLFVHQLTKTAGNFSQMGHIVAFSDAGPRGSRRRPKDINGIENLMLLCPQCHKLIDDHAADYSVTLLKEFKEEHERRIHDVGEAGPELRTEVIQLKGLIGGQTVDIPAPHVREAVRPRYVADQRGHVIDVASCLTKENTFSFEAARDKIRYDLKVCFDGGIDGRKVRHFSVFALAPIPVLITFGRELGDKVAADIYQRHRDNQSWAWKSTGVTAKFRFHKLRTGTHSINVGLVLSLSGKVQLEALPKSIDDSFSLYEITLDEQEPNREFLKLREDLVQFRRIYQAALAEIAKNHVGVAELHLFPAVPAPVAIACGQELLPKAHPDLCVYDYVKGTFVSAIRVNTSDDLKLGK